MHEWNESVFFGWVTDVYVRLDAQSKVVIRRLGGEVIEYECDLGVANQAFSLMGVCVRASNTSKGNRSIRVLGGLRRATRVELEAVDIACAAAEKAGAK